MQDPRVQHICDQIKLLDGQDPEELARLKRQLPIITPHACRFTGDGSRKSANAVPSGLVMLDIDHVAEPRRIYAEHIAPLLSPVGRGDVPAGGKGGNAAVEATVSRLRLYERWTIYFGKADSTRQRRTTCAERTEPRTTTKLKEKKV